MAFVTSELERTKAGQDLPFGTSVRRQLDMWVLFTPGGLASPYLDTDGSQLGCTSGSLEKLLKITQRPDQLHLEAEARKPVSSLLPHQAVHTCRQGALLHESRSTARWFCFQSVPPGRGIFRKRHSYVSSKDAAYCVGALAAGGYLERWL